VRTVMQAGDREDITEPAVGLFCVLKWYNFLIQYFRSFCHDSIAL
jgi:hypothetical protein